MSTFFFYFCEKNYNQNSAKSFLRAQILILEFSIVYPGKIGNFIYRMAYCKSENSNSNYSKSAFKECKELWRGLYKKYYCASENSFRDENFVLLNFTKIK